MKPDFSSSLITRIYPKEGIIMGFRPAQIREERGSVVLVVSPVILLLLKILGTSMSRKSAPPLAA